MSEIPRLVCAPRSQLERTSAHTPQLPLRLFQMHTSITTGRLCSMTLLSGHVAPSTKHIVPLLAWWDCNGFDGNTRTYKIQVKPHKGYARYGNGVWCCRQDGAHAVQNRRGGMADTPWPLPTAWHNSISPSSGFSARLYVFVQRLCCARKVGSGSLHRLFRSFYE